MVNARDGQQLWEAESFPGRVVQPGGQTLPGSAVEVTRAPSKEVSPVNWCAREDGGIELTLRQVKIIRGSATVRSSPEPRARPVRELGDDAQIAGQNVLGGQPCLRA